MLVYGWYAGVGGPHTHTEELEGDCDSTGGYRTGEENSGGWNTFISLGNVQLSTYSVCHKITYCCIEFGKKHGGKVFTLGVLGYHWS